MTRGRGRFAFPARAVLTVAVGVALAAAVAGCRRPPAKVPAPPSIAVPVDAGSVDSTASARAALAGRLPAHAHELGVLARRALGPFVARNDTGALVAWVAPTERGDAHELLVVPLALDGAALGAPTSVARVPNDTTALVVRPATGPHGGWLLAWSSVLDRGESVTALGLTQEGAPRGAAVDLQRTNDHVPWLDVVPTGHGALCVWVEETAAGSASVLAAALEADAKVRTLPARVAVEVTGWQAVPAAGGAGLALVSSAASGRASPGTLNWLVLDDDAHIARPPVALARQPTVSGDIDVVPLGDGWMFGWTDRTGEDARVMLAAIDPDGHARGPVAALNAVGGSSLVALASGPAGAALAWEEPHSPLQNGALLHLAGISAAELIARPATTLETSPGGPPELVATSTGFAALVTARECVPYGPGPCASAAVPTAIRFDAALRPLQTEPLFIDRGDHGAAMGWGLRCGSDDRCCALAASGGVPTGLYAIGLEPRTVSVPPPVAKAPPPDVPRVVGIETLASGPAFDDLAAVAVQGSTLVAAMLGHSDPTGARASRSRGGRIALRWFDRDGQPLAPATTLSTRAVSIGGVAVAVGAGPDAEPAVAWVAREGGESAVRIATVDRFGQPTHEARLATTRGEASSVALAWAGDGWLVAWVDPRDGNGEVYLTRVDGQLRHPGRERRLTHARGDASDVAIAVRAGVAWIAWSDPRDDPREGIGDIFVSTLRADDGYREGKEVRVLATARHSRSPRLAPVDDAGAVVAWIEDAPSGLEGPASAMVARLDAAGQVVGPPQALPLPKDQRPVDIALLPPPAGMRGYLRAVLGRAGPGGLAVDALRLGPSGLLEGEPWPLLALEASSAFDVILALTDDALVFDDIGLSPGLHRIRRATLFWPR